MTLDISKFDFSFDANTMTQDLGRVEQKPGVQTSRPSDKYVLLPKGEGALTVRFLPADTPRGRVLPYASTRLHYINGRSYHCIRELQNGVWRGNCPICNYYHAIYKKSESARNQDEAKAIKDLARKFKPVERYYYNVIVRREYDPETREERLNVGPKILSVGKSLHGRVLRAFLGNKKFNQKPLGNIAHPYTGRDFNIVKQITRGDDAEYPNYDESSFESESVLGDDAQIERWLAALHDLEAERTSELKSYEELQRQVDIVQGKIKDDSLGFNPEEYELPADFSVSGVDRDVEERPTTKTQVQVPQMPSTPKSEIAAAKSPTVTDMDIPFDVDLDISGVEPDWMKDLHQAVNK